MKTVHYHFAEISSTNDQGKSILSSLDHSTLALISADEQTRGRGQFGRSWIASKGTSVLASLCFLLEESIACPPSLTRLFALIVVQTLEEKAGVLCAIKLPNDVFLHGKKIAGVLCEVTPQSDDKWVGIILGIGLNVNVSQDVLSKIDQPATSLLIETGKYCNVPEILEALKSHFLQALKTYRKGGFHHFYPEFSRRVIGSGQINL